VVLQMQISPATILQITKFEGNKIESIELTKTDSNNSETGYI
jgi:hypothetical protein